MKRISVLFLKSVLLLTAVVAGILFVVFPQAEGRAQNLDLLHIYLDPFILYGYIAAIPFFIALYNVFQLLILIENNSFFSKSAVFRVTRIKYCALITIFFLILAIIYIQKLAFGDDPAGPTMLGFIAIFTSIIIATVSSVVQKLLQNAVDLKTEHDLTV